MSESKATISFRVNREVSQKTSYDSSEVQYMLALLKPHCSKEAQIAASTYFRKISLRARIRPPSYADYIVASIMECLKLTPIIDVRLNLTWALTNFACGAHEDTNRIVRMDGLAVLLSILNTNSGEVRDQAIWCFGNIAADCDDCRKAVRNSGILENLLNHLEKYEELSLQSIRLAVWCLVNTIRGGYNSQLISINLTWRYVITLHRLMQRISDVEFIGDAVWCLAHIANDSPPYDQIEVIRLEPNLVSQLLGLLRHPDYRILRGALRAVGNIITGSDIQTESLLAAGVVPILAELAQNPDTIISREALWVMSNVAAGPATHIDMLFAARGVADMIAANCNSSEVRKRKEASWVVVNSMMGGSSHLVEWLLVGGFAVSLRDILENQDDSRLVRRVLVATQALLNNRNPPLRFLPPLLRHIKYDGLVSQLRPTLERNAVARETCDFLIEALKYPEASMMEAKAFGYDEQESRPIVIELN